MTQHLRLIAGTCPSGQAIPDLEAMTQAMSLLERSGLMWLLQGAADAQRAYVMAKVKVEAIELQRDRLLVPIDYGARASLTDAERVELQAIDAAYLAAEETLAATEMPLLAYVRQQLSEDPTIVDRNSEYASLREPALGGRRDKALELAAWLGYDAAPDHLVGKVAAG